MSDDEKNIMIGDLLVRSGLISSADLTEAMQVSRRLGMPMGRVLTMDGRISPDIFQLALEAQSIIRDGIVPADVGIEALGIAARDRQPISEALKRMDRHPQASASTNRLGELLVDAHIITTDQLNQALKISVETGLPLGGTLVTQGIIHASLLPTVLRAQEQIRDGVLPRDAAIEELRAAMKIWAKAEAAMKRTDYAVEQPLKPSSVMSTLRDTLEGVAPGESQIQQHHQAQQPQQALPQHQAQAPMPMNMPAPAQHQPSSLHAQLQQQQQQYYQNQQQHQQQHQQPHAHPQPHPLQHQQTQPMQMPQQMQQQMPQQMQQMPQQMQQMPQQMQQMQQQMPQHLQQPMPQQMQPPMQPPMPAPIYGYNTPYGHAPYGGPAPDDPWGSWHGSVPRHHGLGVPLPGFPQPPAMPPEGYAPPPGYPPQPGQQMPPQGAPPPQNWSSPPAGMPPPPQHVQSQPSSLHAQLQQQQQQQQQYQQSFAQPAAQYPVPQAPTAAPQPPQLPQPSQQQIQSSGPPAMPVALQDNAQHAKPEISAPKQEARVDQADEASNEGSGPLKNAAAQLASRLGWAAPKGGEADSQSDLPSPKKLSWTQPQPNQATSEAKAEAPQLPREKAPTLASEPVSVSKSEPEPAAKPEPIAPPVPPSTPKAPEPVPPLTQTPAAPAPPPIPVAESTKPAQSEPKESGLGDYKPDWSSPSVPPAAGVPSAAQASMMSSELLNPFAAPAGAPSSAAPFAAPSGPGSLVEAEVKPQLPVQNDEQETDDEDDEPDFNLEMDLELPAPFNKQTEKPLEVAAEVPLTAPVVSAPVVSAPVASAPVASAPVVSAPVASAPVASAPVVPVPVVSVPVVPAPIETSRPGQVAGFGKGTKITLKSDYAPNDTGRLFAITQADALTLLTDDATFDVGDDKKDSQPSKGKKGKGKASQSQTKLAKQQAKGKKGQSGKSQTGLQSIKEAEPLPSWLPQKHQTHPAAMFGKKGGGANVPDFLEDLLPAAQSGPDLSMQFADRKQSASHAGASSTQSKMASIKQRAVSLSVAGLLPVSLEIAEAQAELAYIVEHRGAPAPPVSFTPAPPMPPQPEAPATIVELLTLSGFFTKKDIATALDKALEDASMAPDLLMALGLVTEDTLDVSVRCQTLARNRYLTTEQATYVLGAVRSGRLTFEQALSEIGK